MVTFGVSTKSYQTATLNMVTLFFMIMTAFIEIIMPHLISTSYIFPGSLRSLNIRLCFPKTVPDIYKRLSPIIPSG